MPAARAGLTILLEAEVISPSAPPAAAILRTLRRVGGDEFVDMIISCSLFKAPPVKCRARAAGMSFQYMRVDGCAESNPLIDGRHGSRGKAGGVREGRCFCC